MLLHSFVTHSFCAAVIELWELLGRFSTVLHLVEAPDIQDLAGSLTSTATGTRSTFHTAMVCFCQERAPKSWPWTTFTFRHSTLCCCT